MAPVAQCRWFYTTESNVYFCAKERGHDGAHVDGYGCAGVGSWSAPDDDGGTMAGIGPEVSTADLAWAAAAATPHGSFVRGAIARGFSLSFLPAGTGGVCSVALTRGDSAAIEAMGPNPEVAAYNALIEFSRRRTAGEL